MSNFYFVAFNLNMREFNERIIDSKRLLENLERFSRLKVCAMVKAEAYGLGMEYIIPFVEDKVEYFGVANVAEAIKVRHLAPNSKILVCGKCYDPSFCLAYDIEYQVGSVKEAMFAQKNGKVHLKIDSGMNRLGFCRQSEMLEAIDILREKGVDITGVYTHFSTLDCDEEYFSFQLANFRRMLSALPKGLRPLVHIGGSYAIDKDIPEAQMIRIGKGLYNGVMKVHSRLIQVRKVKKGARVGYANGFIAPKDMRIGIVPIGYADGMDRGLANNYDCLVGGHKCRICGNVCMDMFMLDLTDVKAKEGDEVEVMYNEAVMAEAIGTSPYEITTNFLPMRGVTKVK